MKRAWYVTLCGVTGVVAARTRGQAIGVAFRSALEANYQPKWTKARCVRAPRHDEWAEQDSSRSVWLEEELPAARVGVVA